MRRERLERERERERESFSQVEEAPTHTHTQMNEWMDFTYSCKSFSTFFKLIQKFIKKKYYKGKETKKECIHVQYLEESVGVSHNKTKQNKYTNTHILLTLLHQFLIV